MRRLTLPIALLICAAVIVAAAGILHLSGRPWTCICGTVKFFGSQRTGPEESQQFLDWYSFTHVLHGVLFYAIIWLVTRGRLGFATGLLIAVLIESGWEIFENSAYIIGRYRQNQIAAEYSGDSVINSVGDILSMALGFVLAARLPIWATVAIVLVTEAGLAWYIRDNLTLNIINLIHPMDWISQWQDAGR